MDGVIAGDSLGEPQASWKELIVSHGQSFVQKALSPGGFLTAIMLLCWAFAFAPMTPDKPKLVARPEDSALLFGLDRVTPRIGWRHVQ